ncbi:alpha/beta hydrolase [Aquisphaera insulae]|uniref:alpha/beta hydrolase n=1 Tax=Aquisphaera insulae TaxID=2712864 RepID=UPI0013EE1278|nr:alpha/beta hydrolase [Aquisphaera insulae]
MKTEPETSDANQPRARKRSVRRWIRRGFLLWAVVSTTWLANSVRTRGVPERMLRSDAAVVVADRGETLEFVPAAPSSKAGLIFVCGSGVTAQAYAPMLRPIAEAGYPVFIVRLPYRFAFREADKQVAVDRARGLIAAHREIDHWVVSGHSLGGALACRAVRSEPAAFAAMVLLGTTHPKEDDLSSLAIPVTKVYASNDGVAPPEKTLANKRLLPAHTRWIEIEGGNHSQFGHYGHQLFDGTATISREEQQASARRAILEALTETPRGR